METLEIRCSTFRGGTHDAVLVAVEPAELDWRHPTGRPWAVRLDLDTADGARAQLTRDEARALANRILEIIGPE